MKCFVGGLIAIFALRNAWLAMTERVYVLTREEEFVFDPLAKE